MAREVSFAFKNKMHKCDNHGNHLARPVSISELPDEVLISIISCLTLKEAAKTSILSRRWEKLWTFTTGILDFDGAETLMGSKLETLKYQRVKYTDWVYRILKLHQGHSIDEFRVICNLGSSSSLDINHWIEFALLKDVKLLELDLRSWMHCRFDEKVTFPPIEKLTFFANQKMGSSVISCFRPLTAIILKDVNVAQEVLYYFLLKCPFLERLSIMGSDKLVNLIVSGPLLKLKHLAISKCSGVTNIEISAPNLVSFIYQGPKTILLIKDAPRLSELSLGGRCAQHLMEQTWLDISYISQLESLSLKLSSDVRLTSLYPEFNNLTQLDIGIAITKYRTLLWINSIICSCPILHKFAINSARQEEVRENEVQEARKCRHESLKVVELRRFCGRRTYIELALSLLETAVSLEKIIVDTRLPVLRGFFPWKYAAGERSQAARERAMQLEEKLPVGAALVVL